MFTTGSKYEQDMEDAAARGMISAAFFRKKETTLSALKLAIVISASQKLVKEQEVANLTRLKEQYQEIINHVDSLNSEWHIDTYTTTNGVQASLMKASSNIFKVFCEKESFYVGGDVKTLEQVVDLLAEAVSRYV